MNFELCCWKNVILLVSVLQIWRINDFIIIISLLMLSTFLTTNIMLLNIFVWKLEWTWWLSPCIYVWINSKMMTGGNNYPKIKRPVSVIPVPLYVFSRIVQSKMDVNLLKLTIYFVCLSILSLLDSSKNHKKYTHRRRYTRYINRLLFRSALTIRRS